MSVKSEASLLIINIVGGYGLPGQVLHGHAEVMSVNSIDKARRALAANRFDVAVLDVALAEGSG